MARLALPPLRLLLITFSEEIHKQEKWLRERPWVDFFIRLEGEIPFTNLIDSILDNNLANIII